MIITLKHNSTKEEVIIECISWDYSKNGKVYEFFNDSDKKIHRCTACLYNWDLKEIDYETT